MHFEADSEHFFQGRLGLERLSRPQIVGSMLGLLELKPLRLAGRVDEAGPTGLFHAHGGGCRPGQPYPKDSIHPLKPSNLLQ